MDGTARKTGGVVLLDVAAGEGTFDRSILERLGHPVAVCGGPDAGTVCPLLGGEGCSKFDQAHGIVFELDLDEPQHRAIVQRYRRQARPDLPIRVVVRPEQRVRYAPLLAEVQVWDREPTVADLDGFAAEVEAADRAA
ncbi:MAG TPA: hypothetical protein VFA94_07995 [Acidimicrobiales bacterium]|nr:hypothetical protein [Acidimicrobiales bacterium]